MASKVSRSEGIDKAARLVRDGALGPALKEYQSLFAQDPTDWTVANALGDLYIRMGQTEAGVSHFMALAEQVAGDGYIAKARALYRKILRVEPSNHAAAARVAELETQHLDSNPFMQRMLGAVRQSQAAVAAKSSADAPAAARPVEPPVEEEPAPPIDATPALQPVIPTAVPIPPQPIPAQAPAAAILEDEPDAPPERREAAEQVEAAAVAAAVSTQPVPSARQVSPPSPPAAAASPPSAPAPLVSAITPAPPVSPPSAPAPARPAAVAREAALDSADEWTAIDLETSEAPVGDIGAALGLRPARSSEGESFELPPDDWIPAGLRLAALPLSDDPTADEAGDDHPEIAAAFRRLQASTANSAAPGDLEKAAAAVERFLHDHPGHVPALETLIDLGVDGRLESLAWAQIRLANACIDTGRRGRARNVALDLLCRYPVDPRVLDVIGRIEALAAVAADARTPAPLPLDESPAFDELELFDDDGLVTADTRHAAAPSAPPRKKEDTLDEWLDAVDVATTAAAAITRANRLNTAGDTRGAIALLEASMETPGLRPIVGVRLSELYRVSGDCVNALRCLELAAEQPPVDKACGHALAYELGLTLEAMGQSQEALGVYRELLSEVGPAFRDVAARAGQLSAA